MVVALNAWLSSNYLVDDTQYAAYYASIDKNASRGVIMAVGTATQWMAIAIICGAAVFGSGAANATTLYILSIEKDVSEVSLLNPDMFYDSSPGRRSASLIIISVFDTVDVTDFELDCTGREIRISSEKLYDSDGKLISDKTVVNSKGWNPVPIHSDLANTICGWPKSKAPGNELNGPDFWTLAKSIYRKLRLPDKYK